MYKEFEFNGRNIRDFDFVCVKSSEDNSLGLERELLSTSLNPTKNTINIYGTKYTSTLVLHFFIIKNPNLYKNQNDGIITLNNLEEIQSWLMSPKTPKKLFFPEKDDMLEFFGVFTNIAPFEVGDLYGINLTFTCNAPYGYRPFSKIINCTTTLKVGIINQSNELYEYIYPIVTLSPNSVGEFSITNLNDNENKMIINVNKIYSKIVIDCNNQTVLGDGIPLSLYDIGWDITEIKDWNDINTGLYELYWLRLLPNMNSLIFSGNGKFEIEYKIPIMTGGY